MKTLLILGGTSDIARATALAFARDGWNTLLAGRNLAALQGIAQDITVRTGREAQCLSFDACDATSALGLWDTLPQCPDAVLCAVGYLGDVVAAQHDINAAEHTFTCNFSGLIPVLSHAANAFEKRGSGSIIGISSVAGDRGRASNYVYGASKAAMTAFLSGLRQRLAPRGVHVMTVKPGFVATRMTEDKALPPLLTASPQQVADDILCGLKRRRSVVYSRWYWRYIMMLVCALPECAFKRVKM